MIPNMRSGKNSLKPFLDWLPNPGLLVLEVGCFGGDGTVEFLECDKVDFLCCVDPYEGGYDKGDTASGCDMSEALQKWAEQVSQRRGSKPVSLHIGQTIYDLPDTERFDLCYIDGNHREEFVRADILHCLEMFQPKIIAGHDYGVGKHPGVKAAVDKIFGTADLNLFPDTSWSIIL